MTSWSKRDRLEATLKGEKPDRPPVTAYRHFPGYENDPIKLAGILSDFQKKYDWDFVKINPRAVYYHEVWGNQYDYSNYNGVVPKIIKHVIDSPADLEKIVEKSGTEKPFKDQLDTIAEMRKQLGNDIPLYMTVFTPIGILLNLCGARSLGRYRKSPRDESPLIQLFEEDREGVHRALQAITNTLSAYCEELLKSGIDGVFYAGLGMAREGYMTLEEWNEYVKAYDLQVLDTLKSVPILFHTCGIYSNPQRFNDYPIQALHWAESATGNPKIKDCRSWLKTITPMGGVDERLFGTGAADKIAAMAAQSIKDDRNLPFILAPECSVAVNTLDEELKAFRASVENI